MNTFLIITMHFYVNYLVGEVERIYTVLTVKLHGWMLIILEYECRGFGA